MAYYFTYMPVYKTNNGQEVFIANVLQNYHKKSLEDFDSCPYAYVLKFNYSPLIIKLKKKRKKTRDGIKFL